MLNRSGDAARVVTSGVLLGLAGATLLEMTKTLIEAGFVGQPKELGTTAALVAYGVLFGVSVTFAILAFRASAPTVVAYFVPALVAGSLAGFGMLLLLFTVLAFVVPGIPITPRLIGSLLGVLGFILIFLWAGGQARLGVRRDWERIASRIEPVKQAVSKHGAIYQLGFGVALVAVSWLLIR